PWCAWARSPGVPAKAPGHHAFRYGLPRRGWPLRGLLGAGVYGAAENDGAVRGPQIFSRDGLHLIARDAQETFEDGVHELRLVIKESEAGQQMHQAVAGHAA